MDKIDMSLDDIIKQNRKETRKQGKQKKTLATNLKNRPSGPGSQKQGKKTGQAKGGLQVSGYAGQLKQFRARIGGKKAVAKGLAMPKKKKGIARLQQQGGVKMNIGPARKIGNQRVPVKKTAGAQVINRFRKEKQQQQQQQQQQVQQSKAARQQLFNQQRGIQTIAQRPQMGGRNKQKLNQQNVVSVQPNVPQPIVTQQLNRRQRQRIKKSQYNQPAPKVNIVKTQHQNNQQMKTQKMNVRRGNNQRANIPRGNAPITDPKLLTISISNPRATTQNYKPVKINRKKPVMQGGVGSLSDRFGQLQQQPRNIPNKGKRRQRGQQQGRQQGQGNVGRTVLLV